MSEPSPGTSAPSPSEGRARAVLVPLVLLVTATLLLADLWKFTSPIAPPTPTPAWATDTAAIRQPKLRPEITIVSYTYQCNSCHKLFPPRETTGRSLTQHRDVVLEHGINDRCFNCHHPDERNFFVASDGSPTAYDQPQLLCAKCHGPVYRDWLHGVHGRTNGYWNAALGPQEAAEVHRVPRPARAAVPADETGPRTAPTLRMGDQTERPMEPEEQKNPLLIYQRLPSIGESSQPAAGCWRTDAGVARWGSLNDVRRREQIAGCHATWIPAEGSRDGCGVVPRLRRRFRRCAISTRTIGRRSSACCKSTTRK